jgi:predicted RNase H-like nuclease (RuvC/YqgF family)
MYEENEEFDEERGVAALKGHGGRIARLEDEVASLRQVIRGLKRQIARLEAKCLDDGVARTPEQIDAAVKKMFGGK